MLAEELTEGQWVETPHGPAQIVEVRKQGEFRFRGDHRRTHRHDWAIVLYPNGKRHSWYLDKLGRIPQ